MRPKLEFPAVYAFHVTRNLKTGEQMVTATLEKESTIPENRKFHSTRRLTLDRNIQMAIIDIRYIASEDELKQKILHFAELWSVEHSNGIEGEHEFSIKCSCGNNMDGVISKDEPHDRLHCRCNRVWEVRRPHEETEDSV